MDIPPFGKPDFDTNSTSKKITKALRDEYI